MNLSRRKKRKPVPKPLEKRFEKQAYKVANSVASSLFKTFQDVAQTGRISYEDFRQQAFIGVMDAYKRFNPSKGIDFRTFANNRARGEVLSMLRERVPTISVPKLVLGQISSAKAFEQSVSRLYNIALDSKTQGEYNSAMKKISELRSARKGIRPLSGQRLVETKTGEGSRLFDLIENKGRNVNPSKNAELRDFREYLPKAFDIYLDKRTARVLKLRFCSDEHMPMRAIAEILGVSQKSVSNIHHKGLLILLNTPKFKEAIGLPRKKVFSKNDIKEIVKRLNLLWPNDYGRQLKR